MTDAGQRWTDAMRAGDWQGAWSVSREVLATRDPATRDDPALPYHRRWVWDGRPFDGRDVLVRCYHGLGDTIQFARYLPLLAERAASVTLEVQPRLTGLLADLPGVAIIPFDESRPTPSDCDLEITELPFALGAAPPSAPYLRVAPAALPAGTIGLCYAAGDWDADRSIAPHAFAPLLAGRSAVTLVAEPTDLPVLNPEGCPFDMAETAARVAGADLVVTVDTMIAHLAGALGRPTWLLLKHDPDWRWPATGRYTAWYPSVRLYHQPAPGDWTSVLAELARDLAPRDAPRVPVSWGELLDKITILELKQQHLADPAQLANVAREHELLAAIAGDAMARVAAPLAELRAVNAALWDIEDAIRAEEAAGTFGDRFVALARAVYRRNDERAAIKRAINDRLGSALVEEKSYGRARG